MKILGIQIGKNGKVELKTTLQELVEINDDCGGGRIVNYGVAGLMDVSGDIYFNRKDGVITIGSTKDWIDRIFIYPDRIEFSNPNALAVQFVYKRVSRWFEDYYPDRWKSYEPEINRGIKFNIVGCENLNGYNPRVLVFLNGQILTPGQIVNGQWVSGDYVWEQIDDPHYPWILSVREPPLFEDYWIVWGIYEFNEI